MGTQHTKDERINLHLKNKNRALLERAASLEGKTVSSFILTSALEQTINQHEVARLNTKDAEAFFEAQGSAKVNDRMKVAFATHDQHVTNR